MTPIESAQPFQPLNLHGNKKKVECNSPPDLIHGAFSKLDADINATAGDMTMTTNQEEATMEKVKLTQPLAAERKASRTSKIEVERTKIRAEQLLWSQVW